jgi:hypothetical protein
MSAVLTDLLQVVDLYQADTGRIGYAAHDGGVSLRRERAVDGTFPRVARRVTGDQ